MITETYLRPLAAKNQLQYAVQTRIYSYEAFPDIDFAGNNMYPGLCAKYTLKIPGGTELFECEARTPYSYADLARHDVCSHLTSITPPTELGEVFNSSFHYVFRGQYVGEDTPQTKEEQRFGSLMDALEPYLKEPLSKILPEYRKIIDEVDSGFRAFLQPLLDPTGERLNTELDLEKHTEIFTFCIPPKYTSQILGVYDSFFEAYRQKGLTLLNIFNAEKS